MPKRLPALRAREVVRILQRAGFVQWLRREATLPTPHHQGVGLTLDEFLVLS